MLDSRDVELRRLTGPNSSLRSADGTPEHFLALLSEVEASLSRDDACMRLANARDEPKGTVRGREHDSIEIRLGRSLAVGTQPHVRELLDQVRVERGIAALERQSEREAEDWIGQQAGLHQVGSCTRDLFEFGSQLAVLSQSQGSGLVRGERRAAVPDRGELALLIPSRSES